MRTPGSVVVVAVGLAALSAAAPAAAQNVRANGVDSLHVRLNVQPRFDTTTVDGAPSTRWRMRRARLGVRAFVAGFARGELELDAGDGKARLTDAYVRLDLGEVALRGGQFKRPFDALELTSSRELLVVERDGAPRGADAPTPNGLVGDLGHGSRDVGAMAELGLARGRVALAAFNGSGGNAPETDDGKQVVARLEVEAGGGWTLAGAWSGRREERGIDGVGPETGPGDEGVWRSAFEVAATVGEYAAPGFKALVQAMAGDNEAPRLGGARAASFAALQVIVAYHRPVYRTPYVIGIEPAARVGWTDPNDDRDDDEATLWTAGLNVYHHARVKTQLGVDVLSRARGDAETAFRIQAAIGF